MTTPKKENLIHLKDYSPKVNEWGEMDISASPRPQKLKVLPKRYIILIALLILGLLIQLKLDG